MLGEASPEKHETSRPRILVVEDEPAVASLLQRALERHGLEARVERTGAGGVQHLRSDPSGFTAALVDLSLPDGRGETWIGRLLEIQPSLIVVAMSGHPPRGLPRNANVRFLAKPFGLAPLHDLLSGLIQGPES